MTLRAVQWTYTTFKASLTWIETELATIFVANTLFIPAFTILIVLTACDVPTESLKNPGF